MMAEYGITENGCKIKTYEDLSDSMLVKLQDKININSADDGEPLVVISKALAYEMSQLWQLGLGIYNNNFIATASGKALDYKAERLVEGRKSATNSWVSDFEIRGKVGTVISPKTKFSNKFNDEQFISTNTADVTIPEGGLLVIDLVSVNKGKNTNVAENSITVQVNPDANIDSVNNPNASFGGADVETDAELRARIKEARDKMGGSTITAISSRIREINGVLSVRALENVSSEVDANGLPRRSYEMIVVGGDDYAIGKAIFDSDDGGSRSFGNTEVRIYDPDNPTYFYTRYFTRSTGVLVKVVVNVTVSRNSYADWQIDRAKEKILEYVSGANTIQHYVLINGVYTTFSGIKALNINFGENGGTLANDDLVLAVREVAYTTKENIEINVTLD